MNPDYAAAFERQLNWLRWNASAEADDMWRKAPYFGVKAIDKEGMPGGTAALTRARRFYVDPLLYGEVYYISPRIHDWLLSAREKERLPEIPLDPRWCPSEHGFVVLPRRLDLSSGVNLAPITMPTRSRDGLPPFEVQINQNATEATVHAVAFGWSPSSRGLEVCFYSDRLLVDVDEGVLAKRLNEYAKEHPDPDVLSQGKVITISFDQSEVSHIVPTEGYYPIAWFEVEAGQTWRAAARMYRDISAKVAQRGGNMEHADVEIAYLYAFLMFANDRRTVRRAHRADRSARKRAALLKPRPTEHVTVVVLRTEEEAAFDGRDPNSVPIPRNYNVRWNVREHTRRHPRTGLKTIKVQAYVKGPPDKPFKDDQRRIFAVIR